MDIVLGVSIVASFLAGLVALAAPCCVTVVLPTYLAAALKRRGRIVAMTLVYFLGLAAVLVPIIFGVAWLAETLRIWHSQLYVIGGVMMLALALGTLGNVKMPGWPKRAAGVIDPARPEAVFLLGAFSGAATACCAPVLLGAATLSVLTGSFWQAVTVSLAYVAGITFPLFIAALFYDRFDLASWLKRVDKPTEIRWWFGKVIKTKRLTVIAAGIFLLMGLVFFYVGWVQNGYWSPEWQAALGEKLNTWSAKAAVKLEVIPDQIWGAGVLFLIAAMIGTAGWSKRNKRSQSGEAATEKEASDYKNNGCH